MSSRMSARSFAGTMLHLAIKTDEVSDKEIRAAFELNIFSRDKLKLIRDELSAYKAFLLNWAAAVAYDHDTYESIHDEYARILQEKGDQHRTLLQIATNWAGYWNLFVEVQEQSPNGDVQWDKFHLRAAVMFVENIGLGNPVDVSLILLPLTAAAISIVPINKSTEIISEGKKIKEEVEEVPEVFYVHHLILDCARDCIHKGKARVMPNVPETLKNAAARFVDAKAGNRVYVRKYQNGEMHMVAVNHKMRLISQFPYSGLYTGNLMVCDWERSTAKDNPPQSRIEELPFANAPDVPPNERIKKKGYALDSSNPNL